MRTIQRTMTVDHRDRTSLAIEQPEFKKKMRAWEALKVGRLVSFGIRWVIVKKRKNTQKERITVESNHLCWTNRESNPGPLPDIQTKHAKGVLYH